MQNRTLKHGLGPQFKSFVQPSAVLNAGRGPQFHRGRNESAKSAMNSGVLIGNVRNTQFVEASHLASLGTSISFDKFCRCGKAHKSFKTPQKQREFLPSRW